MTLEHPQPVAGETIRTLDGRPGTVVHLGLHKTATTSLQMNLFRHASRPYFGLHGDAAWLASRKAWFPAFFDRGAIPEAARAVGGPFVFSDESILLRAGGIAGVPALARAIAGRFPEPRVLVTVRKPSSLLVSAYFQSPRLRRIALGFRDGRPLHPSSMRFHTFAQWWELLEAHRETSLSGLLDLGRLEAALVEGLGRDRVEVLPIEWIKDTPAAYGQGLARLGFSADEIASFLTAEPENIRATKNLDKIRPWAFRVGAWLGRHGLERPASVLSQSRLRPALDRIMHSRMRPATLIGEPQPAELAEIDRRYQGAWQAVAERASR